MGRKLNFEVKIEDDKKKELNENEFGYNFLAGKSDDKHFYRVFLISDNYSFESNYIIHWANIYARRQQI